MSINARNSVSPSVAIAVKMVAAFSLLLATSNAQADILSGPLFNPVNHSTYYLLTTNTWTASQAEAITLGGNLATINDAAENAFIFSSFSTFGGVDRDLWIGFNDADVEGVFTWISGEPVAYTNWGPGSPSNSLGIEDYVHLERTGFTSPGMWNDFPNNAYPDRPTYGVVEVTGAATAPEPGTLALLGIALPLAGVVMGRRKGRA